MCFDTVKGFTVGRFFSMQSYCFREERQVTLRLRDGYFTAAFHKFLRALKFGYSVKYPSRILVLSSLWEAVDICTKKRFLPTVKPLRLYKREKNQKQFNQKIKTMEFIKLIPNRKKEILWTALRYAGELALTLLLFGAMYVLLILAYAEGLPM